MALEVLHASKSCQLVLTGNAVARKRNLLSWLFKLCCPLLQYWNLDPEESKWRRIGFVRLYCSQEKFVTNAICVQFVFCWLGSESNFCPKSHFLPFRIQGQDRKKDKFFERPPQQFLNFWRKVTVSFFFPSPAKMEKCGAWKFQNVIKNTKMKTKPFAWAWSPWDIVIFRAVAQKTLSFPLGRISALDTLVGRFFLQIWKQIRAHESDEKNLRFLSIWSLQIQATPVKVSFNLVHLQTRSYFPR